jgi:manganese/iron transport system permease protein
MHLLDLFTLPFMRHALIAVILVGVTCAVLGTYVVLRRMAFVGDAMAHTAMPGLVVAYLYGWSLFLGALVADCLAALGIGALSRRRDIREDTAIGILFTGMFALGVVLMTHTRSFRDLTDMLLGNILTITDADLVRMAIVAAVVLTTLALLHKELELTSFDPGYAQVIGLKTSITRLVLLLLLAATVVVGIAVVGVVLTSALLVTPAATASLLTRRLTTIMFWSALFAIASGIAGLYLSLTLDLSCGAGIVLVCTAFFVIVYLGRSLLSLRRVNPSPLGSGPA